MGTSNWQNIPYNIDALMKIEPKKVLDIGVGFGRWGVLVREFCEVWFSRIHSNDWEVRVEGIEAFEPNIEEFQRKFYDQIHIGDAAEVLPTLSADWDVVLFGDVLEHFDRDVAEQLLRTALEKSKYVMVNIPLGDDWPQEEMYGNPYEAHRSEWFPEDFRKFHLVREERFADFQDRPFGVFVLSKDDPKDLRGSLFSKSSAEKDGTTARVDVARTDGAPSTRMRAVEARVEELAFELDFLKACRPVRRLLKHPSRTLRALGRWRKSGIEVEALEEANPASKGRRVALLRARSEVVTGGLPWYFFDHDEHWVERASPGSAYGRALVAEGPGKLRCILRGHAPMLWFQTGPDCGVAKITRRGHEHRLDLYAAEPGTLQFDPKSREVVGEDVPASGAGGDHPPLADEVFAAVAAQKATALAITVDGWLGVGNATRTLFPHTLAVPQNLSEKAIDLLADRAAEAGVQQLVLSGVTPSHLGLAARLKSRVPSVKVDALWHGNYLQAREDYAWRVLQLLIAAQRQGTVRRVGVVKAGMEEWLRSLGVDSALVLNHVPGVPREPSPPDHGGPHLGLWLSNEGYRKLPYAMIAASGMIEGARVRGAGLSRRAVDFAEFCGLHTARLEEKPLPHAKLMAQMAVCHLNLYVTLSECCPMLPLESLSLGVPCLIGPTSHLFEDDEFLHQRLVVAEPERADRIAAAIRRALDEREAIVAAYAEWVPKYEERSRASLEAFLA